MTEQTQKQAAVRSLPCGTPNYFSEELQGVVRSRGSLPENRLLDHAESTATAMGGISSLIGMIIDSDVRACDDEDNRQIPTFSDYDRERLLSLVKFVADQVQKDTIAIAELTEYFYTKKRGTR